MRIALALSGGGVRASVFHSGVLQRLAASGLLEQTTFLSTVSGGSLIAGLVLSTNDRNWPDSQSYLDHVLPRLRLILTGTSIQFAYAWRSLVFPCRLLRGRAHILASQLEAKWGIGGNVSELPASPRWFINATCYETGKNWRFGRTRMGDYRTHYVLNPSIPLSDALAASAAVPGLIGPLIIRSKAYEWHRFVGDRLEPTPPKASRYELWDGGVYDNLGVESLYKPSGGFRDGFDFLIISDASAPLDFDPRSLKRSLRPGHRTLRLVNIATDQIRALRARTLIAEFTRAKDSGVYLRMGNTNEAIFRAANQVAPSGDYLSENSTQMAASFPTTLRCLSDAEFDLLCRHGYEVADATLASRQSSRFSAIGRPT